MLTYSLTHAHLLTYHGYAYQAFRVAQLQLESEEVSVRGQR